MKLQPPGTTLTDAYQCSGTSPTAPHTVNSENVDVTIPGNPSEPKYEYLIDGILPSGRVSLMVGPSGAGKTTLMLQWMESWLLGEPILGQLTSRPRSHAVLNCNRFRETKAPCDLPDHFKLGTILYVAADRGTADTEETMDRVLRPDALLRQGLASGFEWKSVLRSETNEVERLLQVSEQSLSVKIMIIEGAGSLVAGGRVSDNGTVASFLKAATAFAERHKIAIILALHCWRA